MLIQGYAPLVGGAERQLGTVAPLLQARGVRVSVLTRRHPGLAAYSDIDGVAVHRLAIPGNRATRSAAYSGGAVALLTRLRPDVLHAHELFSPATAALAAKAVLRRPVVVTAHRSGPLGDVQRVLGARLGAPRMAALARRVDAFAVISTDIASELEGAGVPAARRRLVPNGVDVRRFRPLEDPRARAALRVRLELPTDAPVVVFAGRLAPEKRVPSLLAAWPAVRAAHAGAVLALLGTGEEEVALRAAAGPGVRFAGAVDDVAPWLQAADVFALPSDAEGLSVAMLEALASGCAALVTDVGGVGDVVAHGRSAFVVPPRDPDAVRAGLLALLGDAGLRTALARAGRDVVERRFSLDVAVDLLADVYRDVAGAAPRISGR